jgi:hypothetical protein
MAIAIIAAQICFPAGVSALDNGLALTPPMGWNSWNTFHCDVSETLIKETADAMVSSGMAAAGYQYVNMDDCWATKSRDAKGGMVADSVKFPSGMRALAAYIHNKGLKLGIYGDRGLATCAGYIGSEGHEVQDADTFAAWGIDYLKYDNCVTHLDEQTQYVAMRDALAGCGRPIVFSICTWNPLPWMPETGNLWRTTPDIDANWSTILAYAIWNDTLAAWAHPGAWNDPDMLEVGNGSLTTAENRAHFSLWAIMAAPLIAGNDLRSMSPAVMAILTNPEVIAVDQDSLGRQGTKTIGNRDVWVKPLRNGSVAVLLLNRGSAAASMRFTLDSIGLPSGTALVRDLWGRADAGQMTGSFTATVQSHDAAMFRVTHVPDNIVPVITRIWAVDSVTIALSFSKPLDTASARVAANYAVNHGETVRSASPQSDRLTVCLSISAVMDSGTTYAVQVNNVKDIDGDSIAPGTTVSFTYSKGIVTRIRFYPRQGSEARMNGGVFEGSNGDRDAGPYQELYTIRSVPAANTWTEVTDLLAINTPYRYVRYRSPDNGFGNVSEIEFYHYATKLTGTAFGTPGSWGGSGNDYTKALDGNTSTFFDYSQANGAYVGIDILGGMVPVRFAGMPVARAPARRQPVLAVAANDLNGRRIVYRAPRRSACADSRNAAAKVFVAKMSDGTRRKQIGE